MQNVKSVSISAFGATIVLLMASTASSLRAAQSLEQDAPSPPTLEERMQRSSTRQIESSLRTQASAERQRQSATRQTGHAVEVGFFSLSAPPRLAPVRVLQPETGAGDSDAQAPEKAMEPGSGDNLESGNNKDEIPPPGLIPYDPSVLSPAPIVPPKPIVPVGGDHVRIIGSAKIPGADGGYGSAGGVAESLLKRLMPGTAQPAGQSQPYMEELLRSFSAQGSAGMPGVTPASSEASGSYSGLESAPLTNFSLVNWLFGL
jgi:hypothetical protein